MILNTNNSDLNFIYQLFEEAIAFQREKNYIGWKHYDKTFIQKDVSDGTSFKIVNGENISGIFSICYADPFIWREKEKGEALYLHRIVANRNLKAEPVFPLVLNWARQFAREKGFSYIRMDTWGKNQKIIDYYCSYGFAFVEEYTTPDTEELPLQHRKLEIALLELAL